MEISNFTKSEFKNISPDNLLKKLKLHTNFIIIRGLFDLSQNYLQNN